MAMLKNYVVTDLTTGSYSLICSDTSNKAVAIYVNNKFGLDLKCINAVKVQSASEALEHARELETCAYAAFSQSGVPTFHFIELIQPLTKGIKIKTNKQAAANIRLEKDYIRFTSLNHFIEELIKKGWISSNKRTPENQIHICGTKQGKLAGAAILYENEIEGRVVIRGLNLNKRTFEFIYDIDDYWNIFQSLVMEDVIVLPNRGISENHDEIQKFMGRYMRK